LPNILVDLQQAVSRIVRVAARPALVGHRDPIARFIVGIHDPVTGFRYRLLHNKVTVVILVCGVTTHPVGHGGYEPFQLIVRIRQAVPAVIRILSTQFAAS
jgi:hypothetical protein